MLAAVIHDSGTDAMQGFVEHNPAFFEFGGRNENEAMREAVASPIEFNHLAVFMMNNATVAGNNRVVWITFIPYLMIFKFISHNNSSLCS